MYVCIYILQAFDFFVILLTFQLLNIFTFISAERPSPPTDPVCQPPESKRPKTSDPPTKSTDTEA